MTDNELIIILAEKIEAAVAQAGWSYVVIQKNGPEQQGIPSNPAVFFEKIFDHRYGHPIVKQTYQSIPNNFAENNKQIYETTFQISALVIQDPSDILKPTASDVANQICMYLQSRTIISELRAQGVSMLRVTEVRNPYFVDDKDRFEGHPTFDFVVYSQRDITLTVPSVIRVVGAPSDDPSIPGEGVFAVPDAIAVP